MSSSKLRMELFIFPMGGLGEKIKKTDGNRISKKKKNIAKSILKASNEKKKLSFEKKND